MARTDVDEIRERRTRLLGTALETLSEATGFSQPDLMRVIEAYESLPSNFHTAILSSVALGRAPH